MTKKSKPWRVTVQLGPDDSETKTFGSETRAYEYVRMNIRVDGVRITVHHWENDRWGLFDTLTDKDAM